MDIRRAGLGDLDDIVRIGDQVQAQHAADYPGEFIYPTDRDAMRGFFAKVLDGAPKNEIVVARGGDGVPVGYLWFERQDRPQNVFKFAQKRLYVHHVGVDASARRQGVGSALFDHVHAVAAAEGQAAVVLDSWSSNVSAHGFFTAQGYETSQLIFVRSVAP